ncbi:carboxylate-amine ligase [Spirosoma taeanense]|uniref:Putative glutamate--cysteine ligase 2 n=1 Tax=Spirosoma taeanense TaxID=2735870 RepID=A0A6M5YAW5_9BACT|nr:carboxylate-amine ligase [Spirosoma taeanense]QJW90363.1 carboxylate-amine ligase [Spirosoma taeanense]
MSIQKEDFTIGVEEEYQIIHPQTRELRSRAQSILSKARAAVGDQVTQELYLSQIEIGTSVCRSLTEVRTELQHLRSELIAAAEREGSRIAAAGTHPFSHWDKQKLTPKERYTELATDYQQLVREQLIFGCHVHVGIPDREIAIQVMNRARPWLAPLLALACNSPFWLGTDTGYASFRTEIWGRWPMSGTPHVFSSRSDYDRLVDDLVAVGSISDASKIYWDIRPSSHYETLEFRVTDVCLTVNEAVMIAGLVRALARTCALEAERYVEITHVRPEILWAAKWQAARFGLDEKLFYTQERQAIPAPALIEKFLTYVRPALEEYGEWDEISALVREVLKRGTGASRQRAAFARNSSLEDVVDLIVAETGR